jgi:regulator of cell morphogenesis and NO signaling
MILLIYSSHNDHTILQKILSSMNDFINQTLSEIATKQNNAIHIFEKYNLDYCCRGKYTLQKACEEKNVDITIILNELQSISSSNDAVQMPFVEMTAEQLINYILVYHHYYIKQIAPKIEYHLVKLCEKHRKHFAWIEEACEIFYQLKNELLQHIQKEEMVLFPRIKKAEECYRQNGNKNEIKNISAAVMILENEHAQASALMKKLKSITNNYTPAPNACTAHCLTLTGLKEFEENLHQHVHLENNILFPAAMKMYNEAETA